MFYKHNNEIPRIYNANLLKESYKISYLYMLGGIL